MWTNVRGRFGSMYPLFSHRKRWPLVYILIFQFVFVIALWFKGVWFLCLLPLCLQTLPLALGLGGVTSGDPTLQMLQQVLTGGLELIADHPHPQKPGAESVGFIGGLGLDAAGAALVQRLGRDGKAELYIRLDLPRVFHGGVEKPEFHLIRDLG